VRPSVRPLSVLLLCGFGAACANDALRRQSIVAFDAGAYEESIASLERAVKGDPSNVQLRLELRVRREAAVRDLLASADDARAQGQAERAGATYRRVLTLEPANDRARSGLEGLQADRRHAERIASATQLFAAKRLDAADVEVHAVLAEDPAFAPAKALLERIDLARGPASALLRLKPREDRPVSLQFRDAPIKMVFEVLAKQTGLNFVFDRDVKSDAKTTVFVNQVPPDQAIELVLAQNQLGRQVLSENTVLVYPNTPAKQKDYRDEVVHTFYLTNAAPKDAESMLKTVLGTKTLFTDEHSGTLMMRDTPEHVRMAEKLVASLDVPTPEVIMEVEVLEISHSLAEQLGINFPTSVGLSATRPPNSRGSASGTVGGTSGLVLSDLARQSSNTLAVTALGVSADLLKTVGASNVLSSPRIRARNKEKAKILVGNRLPVVTSGTSATVGGAFSTSNVQYIDVGLNLEVQPTIHNDGNVAIKLSLEVSSILKQISVPIGNGGTTLAYEIGTRNASTLLELKDGETQVLAGLIQDSDQQNSSHVPGLGDLPILGRLFGSDGNTHDKNEVVLSITPRIVRAQPRPSSETTEFWYGSEAQLRSAPLAGAPVGASTAAGSGPVVPGTVSIASAGGADGAAAPGGPRPPPARIEAAAGPRRPADAGATEEASSAGGSDSGPRVTIEAPDTAKVGDEIGVTVRLASSSALGRIRTQVGFDAAALQLLAAEPGDLASSGDSPKIDTRPGGVQLEFASDGAPSAGGGSLVNLRFRVVGNRPSIAITTQVVLVGTDGVAVAATQATPFTLTVVH
jgi:general secretion pathway protein D